MGYWFLLCISAISGLITVQYLAVLPSLVALLWLQIAGVVLALIVRVFATSSKRSAQHYLVLAIACVLVFTLGMSYATWRAQIRLADYLELRHDDRVSKLLVEVSDLVDYGDNYLQFDAVVLSSKPAIGIPKNIRLRWSFGAFVGPYKQAPPLTEPMPEIKPGEIWQLSALLKRPYGAFNPAQGDILAYRFANNHRAIGQIKGSPQRIAERGQWRWSIEIARIRHQIRSSMNRYLADKRYGAVIIALVMGDQAAVSQEDWSLFNRAGLTHLLSISGTHITMLSSLASLLAYVVIRHSRFGGKLLVERVPAQRVAGMIGILVAFFYAQIAGWGVPAQRSFFMLLIFYGNFILGLHWSIHMVLSVAALLVLLIDPWAVLSTGFWLSFGAMLVLIMLLKEVLRGDGIKQRLLFGVRAWAKSQFAIFLGLAPLLALLFHQVSLVSPLINAYAIFLIGTLVTPASLFLAFCSQFDILNGFNEYLAQLIHGVLWLTLELSAKLAAWPYALFDVAAMPMWAVLLSLFAIFTLLIARFSEWSTLSLLWLLPIFMGFSAKNTMNHGEWQAYVLDVGQGSAILIKTKQHHLLFDLGPRTAYDYEASTKVIIPVLRALGIKHLDYVIVSHSDLDHAGGFSELLSQVSVGHVFSSFRMDHWLAKEERIFNKEYQPVNRQLRAEACLAGHEMMLDGVGFRFIWPTKEVLMPLSTKSENEQSCVLLIEGRNHKLLLTGDIDQAVEAKLIKDKQLNKVEVVVVGHHGSKTSSSNAFIQQLGAQLAIAQAGHYNRYQHPDQQVVRRWLEAGSHFYNTIEAGAIVVYSSDLGLLHHSVKAEAKRYWH